MAFSVTIPTSHKRTNPTPGDEDDNEWARFQNNTIRFPCDVLALILFWEDRNEYPTEHTTGNESIDIVDSLHVDFDSMPATHKYFYRPDPRYFHEANTIREYYRNLHAMEVLTGGHLTGFQQKLSKVLDGDNQIVLYEHLGIWATVTRMYKEDIEVDKAVETYTDARTLSYIYQGTVELEFIRKKSRSFSSFSNNKKWDYWFKGPENVLYRALIPCHTMEHIYIDKIISMNNNIIKVNNYRTSQQLLKRDFNCIMLGNGLDIC